MPIPIRFIFRGFIAINIFVYLSFTLISLIGILHWKNKLVLSSFVSIYFFIISNFGVWITQVTLKQLKDFLMLF